MPWLDSSGWGFGMGAYRIGTVLVGVLVPAILLQRVSQPGKGNRLLSLPAIFTFLLIIAGMGLTVYFGVLPSQDFPMFVTGWVMMTLLVGCALLLIWFGLIQFSRSISFSRPRTNVVVLAIWILFIFALMQGPLPDFFDKHGLNSILVGNIIYLTISVAMGIALILSIIATVFPPILQVKPGFKFARWAKALIFTGAHLLAISMRKMFYPSGMLADDSEIISLAYYLDDMLIYLWLAGMTWLLYREGRQGTNISPQIRLLGLLAGASLLFTVTARWLYIPVTFILGWAALSYFIHPAEYWETIKSFFVPVVKNRLKLLDQVISLNIAEHSYQQYHKVLKEKLSNAEITYRQLIKGSKPAKKDWMN
jgi:hypothetical protein